MTLTNRLIYTIIILLLVTSCASKRKAADTRRDAPQRELRTKTPASVYEKHTDYRIDKVISAARSFMGTPYRWGGTSRAGMDCSGLLVTSFRAADINLPRTTADQVRVGHGISLYELQPGDLVFFAAAKKQSKKITHVGMVTEVRSKRDVRFIHTSTKLGVTENNVYTDYYRKIFIKARRPF